MPSDSASLSATSQNFFSQRLRLHYVEWGSRDNPTIVLVHGIHDHCRTWDDMVERFRDYAEDYHIVAPDLRGHGDSEWVKGSGYQYLDYVYDLYQLIDQNDFGPVVLVGHSLGGAIVALFAGVYPEMVSKLIVIEGIGLWSLSKPPQTAVEKIREWSEATRALAGRTPKRYENLEQAYQRMQHANPQLSKEKAFHLTLHGAIQQEDGRFSWKYDNYTYNFSAMGLSTDETISLWQNISCPVLLINASDGLEWRTGQNGTLEHFTNVQLLDVGDAGHWTYHDQPVVVSTMMQEFIEGAVLANG